MNCFNALPFSARKACWLMFKRSQVMRGFLRIMAGFVLCAAPVMGWEVQISHGSMEQRIGYPSIIRPGESYPDFAIVPGREMKVEVALIRYYASGDPDTVIEQHTFEGDAVVRPKWNGLPAKGNYRVEFRGFVGAQLKVFDSYYFSVIDIRALAANQSRIAFRGSDGHMVYVPDYRGNRLPDFSVVGYREGAELPDVPVKLRVSPIEGDATAHIQSAIDAVSAMEKDVNGFRGAVLLEPGLYEIGDHLRIEASGVVLRGSGRGDAREFWLVPSENRTLASFRRKLANTTATVLIATGPERRELVRVGSDGGVQIQEETAVEIIDQYVPLGSRRFLVEDASAFAVGDRIIVQRRGNAAWINAIGMDAIPERSDGGRIVQWEPFDLNFERRITAIDGQSIEIHAALGNAVEKIFGGGRVMKCTDEGRIRNVGVEHLRAISFWQQNRDRVDDTRHADQFIAFRMTRDGWVRQVTAEHFYSMTGAFRLFSTSYGVTIEDCATLIAAREYYAGPGYDRSGRTFAETGIYVGRYGFNLGGQLGLVRGCYAINNRHAFVLPARIPGPNVFHDSLAESSLTYSEPHHRWAAGGLYDNVEDTIALMNRLTYGSGHGWAGANFVAWNTRGDLICEQPPTAQNWSIGHVGKRVDGPFHEYGEPGYWESLNRHVEPQSLYLAQKAERVVQTTDSAAPESGRMSLDGSVFLSSSRLESLRKRVQSGEAGFAWEQVARAARAALDWQPQVPEVWYVPGYYRDREGQQRMKAYLMEDANAAYALALYWSMTGERSHAEAAVRIINAWSGLSDLKREDDSRLTFAYHFPAMIYAAALVRDFSGWERSDQEKFARFLREKALSMHTLERHNNWANWGVVLTLSIGAYLQDETIFSVGVERWKELLASQMADDGHYPHEVTRNEGTGDRGIWYSHFTLMPTTFAAEIAMNNGVNLFDYQTDSGKRMRLAFDRLAAWVRTPETFPYFDADSGKSQHMTDEIVYFEILNARWPNSDATVLLDLLRPLHSNFSARYMTFTHGVNVSW
jgi:hypothetical protein